MNPKAKLAILVAFSTGMILFPLAPVIAFASVAVTLLMLALRRQRRFFSWMKPMSVVLAVIFAINLFSLSNTLPAAGALSQSVAYTLRIYTLLAAVFLFVETTDTGRMTEAFSFLPLSVRQVLTLALVLLPDITTLAGKVLLSQKARGLRFRSASIHRTYVPVMVPIFAKTLERSEKMALAMEARGFGSS